MMPLTWEKKGRRGGKRNGIRMKQTVEIKERKRKGERKRGRVGKKWVFTFLHIGALKVKSKKVINP